MLTDHFLRSVAGFSWHIISLVFKLKFAMFLYLQVTLLTDSYKNSPMKQQQAPPSKPSQQMPPATRLPGSVQPSMTPAQPQPMRSNQPQPQKQQALPRAAAATPYPAQAPARTSPAIPRGATAQPRPLTPDSSRSSPRRANTPSSTPHSSLPGTPKRGPSPKPPTAASSTDYNKELNPFGDDGDRSPAKSNPSPSGGAGGTTLNPFTGRPYSPTGGPPAGSNPFEEDSPTTGTNPFGEEEEDDGSYNPFD